MTEMATKCAALNKFN